MSDVTKEAERIAAIDEMRRALGQLRSAKDHFDVALGIFERAADRVSRIIEDSQKGADTDALKALACWMGGSDTGLSSMAIAVATLTGSPGKGFPPSDTADFGRCYRLLKAHPMCAEGLAVLGRQGSPVWRGLVANWDELTTLYEAIGYEAAGMEAPRRARYGQPESPERIAYEAACERMYLRMKQIISEAQNPIRETEGPALGGAKDKDSGRVYVIQHQWSDPGGAAGVRWIGGRKAPSRRRWAVACLKEAMRFTLEEATAEIAMLHETAGEIPQVWRAVPLTRSGTHQSTASVATSSPVNPDALMQSAVTQAVDGAGNKSEQQQGDAA